MIDDNSLILKPWHGAGGVIFSLPSIFHKDIIQVSSWSLSRAMVCELPDHIQVLRLFWDEDDLNYISQDLNNYFQDPII